MGPIRSYRLFWRLCFQLQGKIIRQDYCYAIAMQTLVTIAALAGGLVLASWQYSFNIPFDKFREVSGSVNAAIYIFFVFPSYVPMFSMMVRRTRDAGLPPWLTVVTFIPGFGYLWMLILCFPPSKA